MPSRVIYDDDEQIIADLQREVRRLSSRVATTNVTGYADEFTAAATPATTYALTYIPLDGTCEMALNDAVLIEGVDYTPDYATGLVSVAHSQSAGDKVVFRYLVTDWLKARSLPEETSFLQGAWFGASSPSSGYASCYADDGSMSSNNYDHPFGAGTGGAPGPGASFTAVGWYPGRAAPTACAWNNGRAGVATITVGSTWLNAAAAAVGATVAQLDHWVVRLNPDTGGNALGAVREVFQEPFGSVSTMASITDPDPDTVMADLVVRAYLLSSSFTLTATDTSDASSSAALANAPSASPTQAFLSKRGYYTDSLAGIAGGSHLGDVNVGGSVSAQDFQVADQPGHVFVIAVAHSTVLDMAATTPAVAFPDWTATSVCTNTPDTVFRVHQRALPTVDLAPVFWT